MESPYTPPDGASFFVAKSHNMNAIKNSHKKCYWACSARDMPPQPHDTLSKALDLGPVILIFSVNNCHGWHGYVEMLSKPGSYCPDDKDESTQQVWKYFKLRWIRAYLDEHGEKCLSSSKTTELCLADGSPLNNARNFEALDSTTGYQLCHMINEDIQELDEYRKRKMAEQEALRPPTFFVADEKVEDTHEIWKRLLEKVDEMGRVLVACAFGSQRYNLSTPTSDVDMFIVYAAPTKEVLGFNPPQQTIKNRDVDNTCDYTVHEVYRYAELLLASDPRCVETLFLHPSSIYSTDLAWQYLVQHRKSFLTRACCDKYVRDAEGGRGLKLMQKLEKSGEALTEPMSAKVAKLFYIIIRLLQNAREVAEDGDLRVYREDASPERTLLLHVRAARYTHAQLMVKVTSLQERIHKALAGFKEPDSTALQQVVEDWLLRLRFESLQQYMSTRT